MKYRIFNPPKNDEYPMNEQQFKQIGDNIVLVKYCNITTAEIKQILLEINMPREIMSSVK